MIEKLEAAQRELIELYLHLDLPKVGATAGRLRPMARSTTFMRKAGSG